MERHPKLRLRRAHFISTAALLLVALLLRAWALTWGLPHSARFYPYHPDETVLLDAVCHVNPLWGIVTPHFYNYGTLYIFLSRLAYDFAAPFLGWGPVPRNAEFPAWLSDFAHLLLVSRWVTVLLGVGTVLLTYRLARRLFGAAAGRLAALFLAVTPIHVLLGHYMTVDVPATFFTTLALALAATALRDSGTPRARWHVVAAGLAAGLATGTKYNSFPALFAAAAPLWVLFHRQRPHARREALLAGLLAVLACAAGFLVSTPGALLETPRFLGDVLYEMARTREGQGLIDRATLPAALHHLLVSLPVGLEWPLYLLCLAGLAWSLRRRSPEDWLLLLFVVPSFLLLCPAQRKFIRYVTPLVPPLLVLAGRVVAEGVAAPRRRFWTAWAAAAGGAALASTVAHLSVLSGPDARDLAATYLRQNSSSADVVALSSDAFFYTPPVDPTAGCVKRAVAYGGPPVWDRLQDGAQRPDLCPLAGYQVLAPASYGFDPGRGGLVPQMQGALSPAKLAQYHPKRVILTDYEYEDPVRIRRSNPAFRSGILTLLDTLGSDYRLEREFRPRPSLLGFTWWRWGTPPHDWRYHMPTVRIYLRR